MFPDYKTTITLKNGKKVFSFDTKIKVFNQQRLGKNIFGYDKNFNEVLVTSNQIFKITTFNISKDI